MALDDPHYVPLQSDGAWEFLIREYIAILKEKQAHINAGLPALGADNAIYVRRLLWKVKVAKVMRSEAKR